MKNILLKYNFIAILPFEETSFHALTLPKNIKLSQDLLKINYLKYSPNKDAQVIGYTKDKQLMLWFYTQELSSAIVVPESFLLYQKLKKQHSDAIIVIKDHIYKVLVIKNAKLLSVFSMQNFDEHRLKLSSDEFGISHSISIDQKAYKALLQDALSDLPMRELYHFVQLELDAKTIAKKSLEYLAYPLSFFILFSMLLHYTHISYLENKVEKLKEAYTTQRDKNKDISQEIRKHNKTVKRWQDFSKKELLYVDAISLLDGIYTIIKPKEKAIIKGLSVNGNTATLRLQTNLNAVLFLNRLDSNPYIKTVIIQSTYAPRDGEKIITYDLVLKPLKDM